MRALITGGKGFVGQWLAAHLKDRRRRGRGDRYRNGRGRRRGGASGHGRGRAGRRVPPGRHDTRGGELGEPRARCCGSTCSARRRSWLRPALSRAAPVCSSSARPRSTASSLRSSCRWARTRPTEPASPYAASKLAAEAVALQAWRGFGQPVVVVRPFNHIGPGQSPNFFVPALAKRIVEARRSGARSLPVGTLTTRRDFTDVRDVVVAYRLLVERGVPGGVYNVCSGRDVAMSEVAGPAPRTGRGGPHARDRPLAAPPGRRARAAGKCGAAHRRHGLGARTSPRDNARRRPDLVGGGLTASVVGARSGVAQALTRWRI